MRMEDNGNRMQNQGLVPYLSPMGAWAFALGTSVGWGSLVITSSTYLSQAGPVGSILGLLIGAVIMMIVARNYHYLINRYPDAGGAYYYARETFGYDHGFLTAWFLMLTYLAMFWANATSLPLFARYFLGDLFQFGFRYSVFGYDVYFGEALLSIAAILLIALLCTKQRGASTGIMIGLACLFALAIIICFVVAFGKHGQTDFTFQPLLLPEKSGFSQVILIACISPWAFIGFENISHSSAEFTFPHKKVFRVLAVAVISATLLYLFVTLLSVSAYPPEYDSWLAYINDHGNIAGIRGIPAFYAAQYYLGRKGIILMILALLALIVTSLIGNIVALSRLFYRLALDGIFPKRIARLNRHHVPGQAILVIALISCVLPFFGRTAIGWIVDVTTLGATIIYGFVSASTLKMANISGEKREMTTGLIGLIAMIAVALYLLLPNLFSAGSMSNESYILFTVWSIIGFIFFGRILKRDQNRHFGKSIIVWIALLSLILFTSLVWMNQTTVSSTENVITNVREHISDDPDDPEETAYIEDQIAMLHRANTRSMVLVIALFGVSLVTLLNIYSQMRKRADQSEEELWLVKDMANKDPLTGVKSKHAFVEKEKEINARIAAGDVVDFSLVVCDVNGLKHINDTLGHKAGDEYICAASALICGLFQHSPVYRIGGDEFVVLMTGQDFADRMRIMETLNRQVEENILSEKVVVSAGLSDFRAGEDSLLHDVFERADARMYQRKKELKDMGARTRS